MKRDFAAQQVFICAVLGQGAGVLPEEDQVKEGQINVILSDSDPPKVLMGLR